MLICFQLTVMVSIALTLLAMTCSAKRKFSTSQSENVAFKYVRSMIL